MSIRQSVPLWVVATVLFASVGAGQMAYRLLHRTDPGPHTIAELHRRLDTSDLALHVVPTMAGSEEAGVYLCTTPQPREQLMRLLRVAECADRWKGVVFCSHEGGLARTPEDVMQGWDEHGMQLGELLFFGDPALLQRIREAVFPGRRREGGPHAPRWAANLIAARNSQLCPKPIDGRAVPALSLCYPLGRSGLVSGAILTANKAAPHLVLARRFRR